MEATSQQVRAHLGVETQRQWGERAILRTTPALLGLFSLVTLLAHPHMGGQCVRQAAWYVKERPTFTDALALVRQRRLEAAFCTSVPGGDTPKPSARWTDHRAETLCYAN